MDYPASTLSLVKGKWYVSVTVPKAIEHMFKLKQIKLSTGTSDRQQAKKLQHTISQQIYDRFDSALRNEKRDQERRSKMLMQELFDVLMAADGKETQSLEPWFRHTYAHTCTYTHTHTHTHTHTCAHIPFVHAMGEFRTNACKLTT